MRTVYTTVVAGRVIAIDLGTRRIGVAMTDGLGLTAQPLQTIPRRGGQRDLDAIAALIRTHGAERIVIGLPLDPDGEAGRAAKSAAAFAARLRGAVSVPVELIDESFSTVEAEEVLLAADVSRARRREVVSCESGPCLRRSAAGWQNPYRLEIPACYCRRVFRWQFPRFSHGVYRRHLRQAVDHHSRLPGKYSCQRH